MGIASANVASFAAKFPLLVTTIVYSNTSPPSAEVAGFCPLVIFTTDLTADKSGLKLGYEQEPKSKTEGDTLPNTVPPKFNDVKSIDTTVLPEFVVVIRLPPESKATPVAPLGPMLPKFLAVKVTGSIIYK